ncbi:MAG: 23S rRNA (adenine(2503)-C(2))-methyltransferase RlmN [Chloroflexi bacterium HGW-Chloroflexi-1]|nr:MAG: 23S rRNA (adenine(2503)-C(2))-methyltransferase RlmN [Chloroflexi bacterium HGW-Chloroflexi-1]
MTHPTPLLDLTHAELANLLAGWGQPRFRADQVWDWLYGKLATDPAGMTNLPAALRDRLAAETTIDPLAPIHAQRSADGQTIKWLFRLPDGQTIETVLMHYDDTRASARARRTVCISSQAGCAMGCVFCATGQAGLARNLTAGEIVAQVLYAARWLRDPFQDLTGLQRPVRSDDRLTNVVVMGMGEPLANYERVWQALRTINNEAGFNLGTRHITLSTVGLPQGIRRMAGEPLRINLAVSLHAPNDALREKLVPVNSRYPIAEVMAAVGDYIARTNRRVTFEYALMAGIDDTPALAHELAALLAGLLCHVNLIPLNPVAESPYRPSTSENAAAFQAILEGRGIPTTMRTRRGIDIDAGCGQLRRRLGQT